MERIVAKRLGLTPLRVEPTCADVLTPLAADEPTVIPGCSTIVDIDAL